MTLFKKKKFQASRDFDPSMLPHTRKEVFVDVIRLNWQSFLGYGILFLLFMIPLYTVILAEQVLVWQEYAKLDGLSAEEKLQGIKAIYSLQNTAAFLKIPCILIVFIGLSGLTRIIRQHAWEENVFFARDLIVGIKSNCKQFVIVSLIISITNLFVTYSANMSNFSSKASVSVIMMLPSGIFYAVVLPICAYAVVSISIYSNKLGTVLMSSFNLTAKTFFKTLLFLLIAASPLFLLLITNLVVIFAVLLIYAAVFPIILLAWYLFALNQFDKYVNAEYYPELVGRGTVPYITDQNEQ